MGSGTSSARKIKRNPAEGTGMTAKGKAYEAARRGDFAEYNRQMDIAEFGGPQPRTISQVSNELDNIGARYSYTAAGTIVGRISGKNYAYDFDYNVPFVNPGKFAIQDGYGDDHVFDTAIEMVRWAKKHPTR